MGLGLNDNIDDGLVNDNPNTPMGVDPTKMAPQEFSQVKLPTEMKIGKLDKIISISDPELEYKPPTKEELFGQDVVANQVPDVKVKVQVKDELTKLNDLRYGQSVLHERGTVSQEDIQALDNVYKGALINDDNLLGFYTKHASKTQYTQTLKQVNDLINKKVFILNENYQKYLQTLKESTASFKDAFAVNARTIKGYVSLITTEQSTAIKPALELSEMEPVKAALTAYMGEFDITKECHNPQVIDHYNSLKECLSANAKFFKAFIDLHYKKDITVINSSDIRAKMYHDDTRYSVLDLVDFIVHQLPYLEPVVQRTIDKSLINIDTILNNYLNTASTANEKMDIINKNQTTLDEIEQELFVFEQIVKDSICTCKTLSLLLTSIESEVDKHNVSVEDYLDWQISQENLFARIGHGLKKMLTSEEKLQKDIDAQIKRIINKRQRLKDIKEPGWGRVFNTTNKSVVAYSDVDKIIDNLAKTLSGSDYNKAIDELIDIFNKTGSAMEKHSFVTNENLTQEIIQYVDKATEVAQHAISHINLPLDNGHDPDFKPLTSQEATKLANNLLDALDNPKLHNRLQVLTDAATTFDIGTHVTDNSGMFESEPEHIKAAKHIYSKVEPAMTIVYQIYKLRKSYAYALREYIRSSFN